MTLTIKDMMVEYEGNSHDLGYDAGDRTVLFTSSGDAAYIELSMYLDKYTGGSDLFDSDGWVSAEGKDRIKKYLDDAAGIVGVIDENPGSDVPNIEYSVPLTDFLDDEYDSFFFFALPFGRGHEIVSDLLQATESVSFLDRV